MCSKVAVLEGASGGHCVYSLYGCDNKNALGTAAFLKGGERQECSLRKHVKTYCKTFSQTIKKHLTC